MSLEFLLLIGVFAIMLEQIRRLRALVAQQKVDYETKESVNVARISELEGQLEAATDPAVQVELDAFEAELTPAKPAE